MKHQNVVMTLVSFLVLGLISSCGSKGGGGSASSGKGQLVGAGNRPAWRETVPYGMVTVPNGTVTLGLSDQDVTFELTARPKQVSIHGFFMDATEITNNEYRQFVSYVKDSIAHTILEHFNQNAAEEESLTGNMPIDWKQKIDYRNQEVLNQLSAMYYPADQWINGKREMDPSKLVYKFDYVKMKNAAFGKFNRNKDRKQYVKSEAIEIYPDTMVWIRDFTYSYNEPMTRQYFSHPAFDNYPVVGVRWEQANAFCHWRTEMLESYLKTKKKTMIDPFRLPSEHEWEFAARGGKKNAPYPWGGPYTRNHKGCLLANFKPVRGNYQDDGAFYTVRADAYFPNDYGLYNMSGNVAEWTSSQFYENSYTFVHDMNPDMKYDHSKLDNETMKRKVIRGGSWKDVAFLIQCGTRSYEYADSSKSYVGFRCVTSTLK